MRYKGYTGRLLKADLSDGTIEAIPLSEQLAEDYIGGVGLAAALIHETVIPGTDPLDERNPLIFMTGPLTGTIVPWSGRHCVAAISPLTGIWGEAYAGGTWGRELKRAGFDGIVITGKAARPVYLKIINQEVTIEDAASLKGKDTCETETLLRRYCGENVKVAAIGEAGENLVRFAAIIHDGAAARTAARCGVGAVMGSKNLKAIAVRGDQDVAVAEKEQLDDLDQGRSSGTGQRPGALRGEKPGAVFTMFVNDGRHAVNNWRDSSLAGFNEAVLSEIESHVRQSRPYQCAGCPTGCVESNERAGVRQNVWESIAPLGSQCGIKDMHCVQKAYDICNRHGIDTISAGGVISFAMECFEAGLINEKDTDGIRLTFGNGEALLAMLEKIMQAGGVRGSARRGRKKGGADNRQRSGKVCH